ncbi:hypothetical protein RFF05_11225 [Bengtsoniella intestinalis]|uniref:hypothetical protein n=1 Tax=Bengtsoniella intestinalis TaxID=3073143 RepID=UPI00391F235E
MSTVVSGATLAVTIVYVVATCFILCANKKSAELAQKQLKASEQALQKTIDLQLYEHRLQIANKIERDDYSSTVVEFALLFNKKIYMQQDKIQTLMSDMEILQKKKKEYWEIAESQGYDHDLAHEATQAGASNETIALAKLQDEKFSVVVDGAWDEEGSLLEYNGPEIQSHIESLRNEIKNLKVELRKNVVSYIKETTTFAQE